MFDEKYEDKYGNHPEPREKIPVVIQLSIIVEMVSYTDNRKAAIVVWGNKILGHPHHGDTDQEVIEAARRWIYQNFTVPDTYTVYTRSYMGL